MPIARSYGTRKVESTGLPGARFTAAETPTSTGAGLAEAEARRGEVFSDIGRQTAALGVRALNDIRLQERKRANDVALLEAENAMSSWEHDRLYNPETGALATRGKDAMPIPEQVGAEFNQLADAVGAQMTTPEQQYGFARMRAQRSQSLDLELRRHTFGEMQKWEATELAKGLDNDRNMALAHALEPDVIGQTLDAMTEKLKRHGPRAGLGPEAVEAAITDMRSDIHAGVINRLLANGLDRKASAYYEEAKGEIAGKDLEQVEKALEVGTQLGESQRSFDRILQEGGTLAEQRAKAKAIEDPKTRAGMLEMLEHEASVKDRENREADSERLRSAYDIVDKTRSLTKIPPNVWAELDGNDRSSLRHYQKLLTEVGTSASIKTDMGTLVDLITLSSVNPEAFLKIDPMKYRSKLSNADLEQIAQKQASIRSGKKGGDEIFASEGIQTEVINAGLLSIGLDPSPTQPGSKGYDKQKTERVAQFRRAVREAVERETKPGERPTRETIQSVVDILLAPQGQRTVADRWFFPDTTEQAYAFETAQARVTSIAQVPKGELSKIRRALSAHGVAATQQTDAMVLQLFNEQLSRVRKDK